MSAEAAGKRESASISQMIAHVTGQHDAPATVRFDGMEVGLIHRKHVRAAFDQARIRAAEVDVYEQRGWLSSVFVVRLHGMAGQLLPTLQRLRELGED